MLNTRKKLVKETDELLALVKSVQQSNWGTGAIAALVQELLHCRYYVHKRCPMCKRSTMLSF